MVVHHEHQRVLSSRDVGVRPQHTPFRRSWQWLLAALAALVAGPVLLPSTVYAANVVALTDPKVAQFQEAVKAARDAVRGDLPEVDVNAADAADQLKRHAPAVVLAVGQKSVQIAKDALPSTPVVYCMALERNVQTSSTVTGVPLEISPKDQLAAFREVNPAGKRIGVVYDPKASQAFVNEAEKAAKPLGFELKSKPVTDPKDVRSALEGMSSSIDALWLPADPRLINGEVFKYVLVFTIERKIALYGFLDNFTKAGALAAVAPDYVAIGKLAGGMALEISQRPPDKRTPVPPPATHAGQLSVNLKTSKSLGIDVPTKAVDMARQVYR